MTPKPHIDAFGAASLVGLALLLAFNQVVIKVANDAFQPVFFAGARSAGAVVCILLWMRWRGMPVAIPRPVVPSAVLIGCVFSVEFILLFTALDLTTVSRASVIFYSMPVWLALSAHFLIPGDRLTSRKALGLVLAFTGVAWAILDRSDGGEASLLGDLCALGAAMSWALLVLLVKITPLRTVRPEVQLFYQVLVSGVLLLAVAPLFGPLFRDPQPIHYAALAFQIVVVVTFGFIFFLWLISIYPASGVASFSFLSPVLSVLLGWALLGEQIGVSILGALGLVAVGIVLINRAPKAQVPQKV
ncbi:DMT family transporter [Litoreibacter janthinus]|uniref:Permease of the drug/metabolite transporter (DMT) superfamily n=1 Tax=Litoreibacter janthinus TaxID=670154 RepID=A0A1I6GIU8_9RHOB|nr:DMT family transporter [Litoreibacter janthinus]SFR42098.1 Permease of the drug/metabolite transporter (DMT) superfamily [Litoreibacter janthinus]